jgi:hypothetical protein
MIKPRTAASATVLRETRTLNQAVSKLDRDNVLSSQPKLAARITASTRSML